LVRLPFKLFRNGAISALAWMIFAFPAMAQLQVPAIPSNTQLSNQYEYSAEYLYRVNLDGTYLEDGTIIAYVDGQLRGAQSASVLFPPTGAFEYKVRVFSNDASGDTITFRYYDVFNGKIYEIDEKELFVADNVPDYYNPTVLNAACGEPGKATGLLPGDQATGLDATLDFFWQPSVSTLRYGLFLWKEGDPVPSSPYAGNIYNTSVRVYNLTYGATYHWFIQSLNQCLQANSLTQTFTVRELPDLVMTGSSGPDTVLSVTPFEVAFTVKNQGTGSATGTYWYDAFFLSTDNVLSGDDRFLDQAQRSQALEPDSSYGQTLSLSIPTEFAGDYYLIGTTDRGNRIPETDNTNNNSQEVYGIFVIEKPLPDVMVSDITADKIIYRPGDSIDVSWNVRNIGDAAATGGWTERVSVVSLSGIRLILAGTPQYTGELAKGGSVARNYSFVLPGVINFSGEAYVEVELIPSNELLEYPGHQANNRASSANRISVQNRLVLNVPGPVTEDYSGQVRCYVTRSGNYAQALTVNLTATPGGQVNIPASVTIPELNSTALFDITMVDNALLDGPRQVVIGASATGYDPISQVLEVLDNEKPTLTLSLDKNVASEGDTLRLTVTRDLVTSDSAMVQLSTNLSSQWTFPNTVVIGGGQASVQAKVAVTDNATPELNQEAEITASAQGMISGSVTATILDDDIPEIELQIFADTVSEGAGPYATWGVIRRTGSGAGSIRVNLSADLPGALYFPASITLSQDIMEKQFNVGVVDNGLVDGYRTVVLTGSIYISSCNCNTSPDNGGVVTAGLTIADNDGPSLSVTVNPVALREGLANAGTMTIFRNTATTQALSLTLSSSDTSEIILPATAVIPAGQSTVAVPIQTKDDHIDDGSQMVTLTAASPGFSPGFAWANVTDINRPDLVISDLELAEDTVITGRQMEVQAIIQNNGFGKAPSGIRVKFYLSKDNKIDDKDSVVFTTKLADPIPIGNSAHILDLIPVPPMTGKYYLIAKVNPEASVTELLYINNESYPVPLTILPNYTGMAVVDEDYFMGPEPVTVHGQATLRNGNPAAGVDLDVYVITGALRRVLEVTTDGTGKFSTVFEPNSYESGHYLVGACFPGQGLSEEQDAFDILGMERSEKGYLIWNVKKNVPTTGTVGIKNRSNVPLTRITFEPLKVPDGFNLTIDTIDLLPGNQVVEFNYTALGEVLTQGKNYVEVPVKVSSAEGISFEFKAYYYCQALGSHLLSRPASINTTITKGKSRYYDLKLINDGAGETGRITLDLPKLEWMSLASPDTIVNLVSGDTATITVLFTPGNDIPLNTPLKGRIVAHNTNGDDLAIPYQVEVVSEATGGFKVDVVDEYSYFTEAAPHVQNAHVVIRHPYSGKIVAEGFTNPQGIFEADSLAEGSYRMTVEADKHEGYQNIIVIDPGRVNEQTVFLSFQAITYTWEVVPTEIEDEYQVDLVMQYETNVPAPVVIIEMPKVMPQLFNDETYTFLVTLTNKGLITAQDVQLRFPENDPEYEWVTDFTSMDLLAQQAIQIPVTMRRKATQKKSSGGPCKDYVITIYGFECGKDRQWHQTGALFTFEFRVCPGGGGSIPPGPGPPGGGTSYGPSYTGDPSTYYNPYTSEPTTVSPSTGCDPCLISIFTTLLGCVGGNIGGAISCIYSFLDGDISASDVAGCIPGPVGCIASIISTIETCYETPPFGIGGGSSSGKKAGSTISPAILQAAWELAYGAYSDKAERAFFSEYMGSLDWEAKESLMDFLAEADSNVTNKVPFDPGKVSRIKQHMDGTDISEQEIDEFVHHWNSTLEAWDKGIMHRTPEYPDIISQDSLDACLARMDTARNYALSLGYSSVGDMKVKALNHLKELLEGERSSVCASVSIKISQKLVMTREAFEGTLTIYNGNKTTAMQEVKLNLEIRNSNGELANDLFEIETKALDILTGIDGTGSLGADQTGSATILFIPEKGAAPEVPESYSFGGSFSYLDPFTGVTVKKPLFPVTLAVNPSPDLFLHYFMQRDILGDDPLTEPIEPIVPAELAVMIENNGYGTARKVRIESAQPEIVDNEKGLAIHFELIGSNLNGQPRQLGLINIDFGNIPPKSTTVGQWWFTSDLLGHFVNYEASVTHLDSRGNPDLSLVSGATLHELIRSIRVYGATDDGINDFLVNEYQDVEERPDVIYLSQGQQVLDVFGADLGLFEGSIRAPEFSNTLKVIASRLGWNYVRIPDPGNGRYDIVSVSRTSDGQEIPPDNAWLTFVTLPDGKEPVYENKFHMVDVFEDIGEQDYTITWKLKDPDPPAVLRIDGAPSAFVSHPVTTLNVKFNKEIDPATFTWEDMMLRLQGGDDIMDSTVLITRLDEVNYSLDLSALTTGNGFYVLTVQAAGIQDMDGTYGKTGKQVSWTQFLNVPMVEEFIGLPEGGTGDPFDYMLVRFNLPIDVNTLTPARFIVSKDGVPLSGTLTVTLMDTEARLFKISGLAVIMASDGQYSLTVDLPNIATINGETGLLQQEVGWTIDTTPPSLLSFTETREGGFDEQHVTGMEILFSEPVSGFGLSSIELWKDGQRLPLSQVHIDSVSGSMRELSQFRLLTYYSGNYTLKVKMNTVYDRAGIAGDGIEEYSWSVDRLPPGKVENLRISPDLGYSATDGITSTRNLTVFMDVVDPDVRVEVYDNDFGTLTLLADSNHVAAGALALPVRLAYAGNILLEVHCIDSIGNFSTTQLPIVVDEYAFQVSFRDIPQQPVTAHPGSIRLLFSDRILASSLDIDALSLRLKGDLVDLSGVVIQQVSDSLFTVSGLDNLSRNPGDYTLTLDLTRVEKYLSGMKGTYSAQAVWTLLNTNSAPVADAGEDFEMLPGKQYFLDASGSYDPDNDQLNYEWFPPAGILLDDPYGVNPSFVAMEKADTTEFTFLLSVSDGLLSATDRVNAHLVVDTTAEKLPGIIDHGVLIYPNPSEGFFTVSVRNLQVESVSLIDFAGKVLMHRNWTGETEQTFHLDRVPAGIYIIRIKTYEKVIMKKIIIL
jgi:hypothetical protein